MVEIEQTASTTTIMVEAISEKRCGCYIRLWQAEYKMRPKGPIYNKYEGEKPKAPKFITLEDELS